MNTMLKPFLFSLLLLGVFQGILRGQSPEIDSLTRALEEAAEDTNKVNTLNQLAMQYIYADRELSRQYTKEAMVLSEVLNFDQGKRHAQYIDMTLTHFDGDAFKAIEQGEQLISQARQANDLHTLARSLNMMSNIYQSLNNLEKALEVIKESTQVSLRIGDINKAGVTYYTTASIYQIMNENDIAISYLEKAIELFEQDNDEYKLGIAYQGLAACTSGEVAIEHAKKGLEILEKTNDLQGQGHCHWMIASELINLDRIEEAFPYIHKALEIFTNVDYPEGLANVNLIMGNAYLKLGWYRESYPYLLKAKEIAHQRTFDDILQLAYRNLAEYYAVVGQTDLMSDYLDSFTVLRDTLYSREKAQLLIESETRFQTKEKEAQLVQQELALARQTRLRNFILFGSIIAIITLLAVFQSFRSRQQLKRQEAELSLQLKQAEAEQLVELDRMKSIFFANISHEFRTPLTLILGPIKQARDAAKHLPGFADNKGAVNVPLLHLDIIQRNAMRLKQLINQLLDLSKLESGKMKLSVAQGNIVQLIRAITFSFESLAERKSIAFETRFPEEIPHSYFDSDKLNDIIINLLSNAFKFTPEGGNIQFLAKDQNGKLHIQIRDSGKGIPQKELDKIFNRFYQVEGTEHQGTGIGLSLVKELTQLHKGIIRVESEEGVGTSFFIEIPYESNAYTEEEKVQIQSTPEVQVPAETLTALKTSGQLTHSGDTANTSEAPIALIIEDNPDLRVYISEYLKDRFRVHLATNGEEGLKRAIELVPDIIISDVMMPKMDGFELSEAIKKEEKTSHIPIILLTAKAGQEHKIEGLQTGADDYLTKPFDGKELQVRIDNLIEQRRRLREKFSGQLKIRPSQVSFSSVDQQFLEQVMHHIEANMGNEQFSVEDLAGLVNFSRSQLHRKLKAICDKSPVELIRNFRLTRAKEMLEQKAGTVSEIAYEVGYSNLSYFSSSFKKAFGQLPSEI